MNIPNCVVSINNLTTVTKIIGKIAGEFCDNGNVMIVTSRRKKPVYNAHFIDTEDFFKFIKNNPLLSTSKARAHIITSKYGDKKQIDLLYDKKAELNILIFEELMDVKRSSLFDEKLYSALHTFEKKFVVIGFTTGDTSIIKLKYSGKELRILSSDEFKEILKGKKDVDDIYKEKINIDDMDGHEFERYCASLLEKNGFENVHVTPGSGDQGIDILCEKDEVKYGIQCKCYSKDIGNKAVQEAYSGAKFYNCHVPVVITNRSFTVGAKEVALKTNVLLWDRKKLEKLIMNSK